MLKGVNKIVKSFSNLFKKIKIKKRLNPLYNIN